MKYIREIVFIIIIIVIYSLVKNNKVNLKNKNKDLENINKLLRQTARWAIAAEQDINPYISNLHATYSLGYLMALKEIYSEDDIFKYANVDVRVLESEITKVMDNAISKLAIICPEGKPKNQYLAYLSKQGDF